MAYRRKMDMIKLHHALVNCAMRYKTADDAVCVILNFFSNVKKREADPDVNKKTRFVKLR